MAYKRKLGEIGRYSNYVTIPKALVASLRWKKKQNVTVVKRGGAIVIRDARSRKKN